MSKKENDGIMDKVEKASDVISYVGVIAGALLGIAGMVSTSVLSLAWTRAQKAARKQKGA